MKRFSWWILVAALLASIPQVAAAGGETGNGRSILSTTVHTR